MIPDPEDKKPDDWPSDDVPATIPDTAATKPDDWDDEDDGEWKAPMIPNPLYKGEWQARLIENPAYKVRVTDLSAF
jgi:calreticulin